MIKPIIKDPIFLAQKFAPAVLADLPVAQDLRDTLAAHRDGCVGMAANMIGVARRIIIFDDNGTASVMFNPEIIKSSGRMRQKKAACLSPERGKQKDTVPSKCGIRTSELKCGSRPIPAGPRRLFSMK